MMVELSEVEVAKLVSLLKQDLQTDLVVKLLGKLEVGALVQDAAERGFGS